MLRIRDVYPEFRVLIFFYPGSRIQRQKQKGREKLVVLPRTVDPFSFRFPKVRSNAFNPLIQL
jgi:hypothetical protein